MPFWFKTCASRSQVLLWVAKMRMLSSFLKESERRSESKALYFSWSLVMDSCKFKRDRSGWVMMCSG